MCKHDKENNEMLKQDYSDLFDLVEDAITEWQETNHEELDSTEIIVPMVFHEFLASHFIHHFVVNQESIDQYLDFIRKAIYEKHGEKIRRMADEKMKEDYPFGKFTEHGVS
tara:strand:- start:13625 stop:13957 length:333 start_codon:yes stop_codon:yes gene_type:complete